MISLFALITNNFMKENPPPPRIRIDRSLPFGGVGERIYRTLGFAGLTGTDVTDRDCLLQDGSANDGQGAGTNEDLAVK